MLRFCAAALSASLLLAGSFSTQASSVEAEWITVGSEQALMGAKLAAFADSSITAEMATLPAAEDRRSDAVLESAVALVDEPDAVMAALAPENFLDTDKAETGALIAADLAAAAGETTSSVEPSPVLALEALAEDVPETLELIIPNDEAAAVDQAVALP
jgi:hypothetical protein